MYQSGYPSQNGNQGNYTPQNRGPVFKHAFYITSAMLVLEVYPETQDSINLVFIPQNQSGQGPKYDGKRTISTKMSIEEVGLMIEGLKVHRKYGANAFTDFCNAVQPPKQQNAQPKTGLSFFHKSPNFQTIINLGIGQSGPNLHLSAHREDSQRQASNSHFMVMYSTRYAIEKTMEDFITLINTTKRESDQRQPAQQSNGNYQQYNQQVPNQQVPPNQTAIPQGGGGYPQQQSQAPQQYAQFPPQQSIPQSPPGGYPQQHAGYPQS